MKVLQVNCVYGKGSTGKITYDLHQYYIGKGINAVVCYGRGEKINETNVIKISTELYSKINNAWSRITGLMYGGCILSTTRLIYIIKQIRPDIVHLHCINGYFINIYRLVSWLKKNKIKTVVTLHAEFIHTANCGYALDCNRWQIGCGQCPRMKSETKSIWIDGTAKSWKKMQKAFAGFDQSVIVSVSPWLLERAKLSPILSGRKHCVIYNGININVFRHYNAEEIRGKYGIHEGKIVFHATPYLSSQKEHIKGGWYVTQLALKMPEIQFVIAGSFDETLEYPPNVLLLGKVNDQQELAKLYSMADLTLLTSQKETYSMVTVESLCCGTPVVGFKAGAPEMITMLQYSTFVEYGDLVLLRKAVEKILYTRYNRNEIEWMAHNKYSKEAMADQYIEVYEELINDYTKNEEE